MALDLFIVKSIIRFHLLNMNKVPIVFAFDNNLVMPASVCIASLMMNANEETFYDIFILHPSAEFDTSLIDQVADAYSNCRVTFLRIADTFSSAFETRGVTVPTYYRLLIPDLILEYDKVIYSDVDMIFRMDLSDIYSTTLRDEYLAATYDLGMNLGRDGRRYINSLPGLKEGKYIQAGFLIINSRKMREDNVVKVLKEYAKNKFKFQDQDILNIVCADKIKILPMACNMTDYSFLYSTRDRLSVERFVGAQEEIDFALASGNLHYNGHKPWIKYSVNFDIWWEYYRKSPAFSPEFYFNFFYGKLNELDQLSLWKRIKVLLRYFVYGRRTY